MLAPSVLPLQSVYTYQQYNISITLSPDREYSESNGNNCTHSLLLLGLPLAITIKHKSSVTQLKKKHVTRHRVSILGQYTGLDFVFPWQPTRYGHFKEEKYRQRKSTGGCQPWQGEVGYAINRHVGVHSNHN